MAHDRRRSLRRHPDFRRLWVGETVSQFGSQVTAIALPLVAISVLHASTFEVGTLSALETAAFLIIGLPAGAVVDRMRFRLVLVANDLIRAVAIVSVPVAQALGALTIAQLFMVAIVTGLSTVFFDVAYQSYLPELVEREDLVHGNSLLQASESMAQVAGPGVGGLLVQVISAPFALLVDAASFLWSAGWMYSIRARPSRRERAPGSRLHHEVVEGLRFVLGNRVLRAIAMCTGSSNLLSAAFFAAFYVLLARELHLPAGVIGLILSASSVGGLLGSLLARRIAEQIGQGPAIWGSALLFAPPAFVAPFVQRNWTLGLLAAASIVQWTAVVVYNITQVSFSQGLCPPRLLGRMNATMRFLVWGTLPVGSLLGGALGTWIGVRPTLLLVAVLGVLPFLPVFLSPLRRARDLPQFVSDDETVRPASGSSLA